jgi:hypothetical protein
MSKTNDDCKRPLGVLLRRLAESVDAVGDGLDTGHGGASTREALQADGKMWRLHDRCWMATSGECPHRSDDDDEQQRANEEIGGDEEGRAGIFDPRTLMSVRMSKTARETSVTISNRPLLGRSYPRPVRRVRWNCGASDRR